jgi:glyoxylase I family protein
MPAFSHVAISCADPLATERFYTKHFGFERVRVVPLGDDEQIVFLRSGTMCLELFAAEGGRPTSPPTEDGPHHPGWRHIAFEVDDVDAKLDGMGEEADVSLGPMDFDDFIPGWRTVWVKDPDGNIVEITQGYTDQEDPPPLM